MDVPEFLEFGAARPRKFQNHRNLGPPSPEKAQIIGARGNRTQKVSKKCPVSLNFGPRGQENVPELGLPSQESAQSRPKICPNLSVGINAWDPVCGYQDLGIWPF